MQERAKRLANAVVLTVADIAVINICFGTIWLAWDWNPWANAALFALLAVWIASATVLMSRTTCAGPFANGPSLSPAPHGRIPAN